MSREQSFRFLRAIKDQPKGVNTGRVYTVDVIGRTAMVRFGGGASGVRLRIQNQTIADSIATLLSTNIQPTVLVQNDIIIDVQAGGGATTNSTTTVIVSGIDVSSLNSDFYSHAANANAHHTAFIGVTVNGTNIAPNVGARIVLTAAGGIQLVPGVNGFVIQTDGTLASTTRNITAGSGLTGGGDLTADRTINVGQGNGITVAADAVAVNEGYAFQFTGTPSFSPGAVGPAFVIGTNALNVNIPGLRANSVSKNVTGGAGLTNTGGTLLTSDITLNVGAGYGITVNADDVAVNQAFAPVWTGIHQFNVDTLISKIKPRTGNLYDIGQVDRMFRDLFVGTIQATIFAEQTISLIGGWLRAAKDQGTILYDVDATQTIINFSKTMIVNDFIEFRGNLQREVMQITAVSPYGAPEYVVTRNLDGGLTTAWTAGSAYSVNGQDGNGWIDINASGTPKLQMFRQGATWNDQKLLVQLGDLNGNWGYPSETYGLAIGEFAAGKSNIVVDSTGMFRLRNFTTDILRVDSTGAFIAGVLNIGTDGGIFQGTGTFALPTAGLKLYRNAGGIGLLEGYSAGVKQVGFNANGEIEAGAGNVKLNSNGLSFYTGGGLSNQITWNDLGQTYPALRGRIRNEYSDSSGGLGSTGHHTRMLIESFSGIAANINEPVHLAILRLVADNKLSNIPVSIDLTSNNFTGDSIACKINNANVLTLFKDYTQFGNRPFTTGGGAFPALPSTNYVFFRTDFRAWFQYDGAAWRQTSVGHFASTFPASPVTNMRVFREDWRALFTYDGATWRQTSVGEFTGAFPASPTDNLRVFRSDRDLEYFWNSATSQWLTTTIYTAPLSETRNFAPYSTPNIGITEQAPLVFYANNVNYAIRTLDTRFFWNVSGTNSAANFWHYRLNYANNDNTGIIDMLGTAATPINTSAVAINANDIVVAGDVTIPAYAKGGRFALFMKVTGTPSTFTFRGEVRYRMVG